MPIPGLPVQADLEVQAEHHTTAVVIVMVVGLIPVTVGRATVPRFVVPRTATQHSTLPHKQGTIAPAVWPCKFWEANKTPKE
jgi:hypothetical protein